MPNIDTLQATEQMLDGMSNFITEEQWANLLLQRSNNELKDYTTKLLSPEFVIKYKNSLCFDTFTNYVVLAWKEKNLTWEFIQRFWKHVDFIGGGKNDILLDHPDFNKGDDSLSKLYNSKCDPRDIGSIMLGKEPGFTMDELDKHPYRYNGEQWNASINVMKELTLEFIEKYIHLIQFEAVITNENLSNEFKRQVRDTFAEPIQIDKDTVYIFPDGSSVHEEQWENCKPGRAYFSNLKRCPLDNDKLVDVFSKLKNKFPRAFEDCMYPENAIVMVDK